jgi:NitT/TauT family transport system substrate-binding protein
MTADAAADAFADQQVDVALSFDPYLRKGAKDGGGKVIFSTQGTNLIADVVLVRDELLQAHKNDVKNYLKVIDKSIKLFLADDPEALKMAGVRLGASESEVKQQKAQTTFFDAEGNKKIAFNPNHPQNIMANLKLTTQAAYDFRLTDKKMDVSTLTNDTLVKAIL